MLVGTLKTEAKITDYGAKTKFLAKIFAKTTKIGRRLQKPLIAAVVWAFWYCFVGFDKIFQFLT